MIDVEQIIDKLVSLELLRVSRPVGKYMQIYCPIHNNGQERKPSCGILLHEEFRNGRKYPAGFCHCFSCGYAQPIDQMITDILKSRHISKSGLDWLKENIPGFDAEAEFDYLIPESLMEQVSNTYALNYIKEATNTPKHEYVSEKELSKYRFTIPYMYERKLTDELIDKFDVGFDADYIPPGRKRKVPSVTFPVRDSQGRTLFICRRSVEGKRFDMPEDVNKPVYGLYELPKNPPIVVICESCFNALTCWRYGIPGVALLGTGTPYQWHQLRQLGVKEFVIGTDPDEAGNISARKIKRELKGVAIIRRMSDIPLNKDINDLTEEEFKTIFSARV